MENTTGNKYKMFRNYMANELGITKEEIKLWCKEAVEESVRKLIGQINVHGQIEQAVKSFSVTSDVKVLVAKRIADSLTVTIQQK